MDFTARLLRALGHEWAISDIEEYLGTGNPSAFTTPFAGRRFEEIDGGGDRTDVANAFTAADVAAIGTLSVALAPQAIDELLFGAVGRDAARALARIPTDIDIYDPQAQVLHDYAGTELWEALFRLKDVGRTKASKLIARKRPHLFPVIDSVVVRALGDPANFWQPTLKAYSTSAVRDRVGELRRGARVPSTISDLRVSDIAVWMRFRKGGSQGRPSDAGQHT